MASRGGAEELHSSFSIQLGEPIQSGTPICVGKFNGKTPCLALATPTGRVLIHDPQGVEGAPKSYLNINKRITALATHQIRADVEEKGSEGGPPALCDLLVVGTPSTLQLYNVVENADIFYKDVPDGVFALAIGLLPEMMQKLIFVGGNCSVQGFDNNGEEMFWTVTGDVVSAMSFVDVDGDGKAELLVASNDFDIRAFKDESASMSVAENDKANFVLSAGNARWVYALGNGSIGLYHKGKRQWCIMNKNEATGVAMYDIDADGQNELIIGWKSGEVTAHSLSDGRILYKTRLPGPVAGVATGSFRALDLRELIVSDELGNIRGYSSVTFRGKNSPGESLEGMESLKVALLSELDGLQKDPALQGGPRVPPDTAISCTLRPNFDLGTLDLCISLNNTSSVLVNAIITDREGAVLSDGHFVAASVCDSPGQDLMAPFIPARRQRTVLEVQAHVGARGYTDDVIVFAEECPISRFATFSPYNPEVIEKIDGFSGRVTFTVGRQIGQLCSWLSSAFGVKDITLNEDGGRSAINMELVSVERNEQLENIALRIEVTGNREGGPVAIKIECSDMQLAVDVIDDLCSYLEVDELQSLAHFPVEMDILEASIDAVQQQKDLRQLLSVDMAEDVQRAKALVVRAEDARMRSEMKGVRRAYANLQILNQQLVGEYLKRENNHQALLAGLKEINTIIQRASNLRVGAPRAAILSACRMAIKQGSMLKIKKIIEEGVVV